MCEIKHDINHVYKYNYTIINDTVNIHSYALHNTTHTHTHTHTHMHKVPIELSDGFNISSESITDINVQN